MTRTVLSPALKKTSTRTLWCSSWRGLQWVSPCNTLTEEFNGATSFRHRLESFQALPKIIVHYDRAPAFSLCAFCDPTFFIFLPPRFVKEHRFPFDLTQFLHQSIFPHICPNVFLYIYLYIYLIINCFMHA